MAGAGVTVPVLEEDGGWVDGPVGTCPEDVTVTVGVAVGAAPPWARRMMNAVRPMRTTAMAAMRGPSDRRRGS